MTEPVEFAVTLAPSEELFSPDCQHMLGGVLRDLQAHGLKVSSRMHVQDSADTGGMWFLGQFTIEGARIVAPALTGIVGAYLGACMGRKVKLKQGDIEVEAHNVEELQRLLAIADERKGKPLVAHRPKRRP